MRFFKPTPSFLEWIGAEAKRLAMPVAECGCGDGDLLREMIAAGIPALGFDPRFVWFDERVPFDLCSRIMTKPAEESPIVHDTPMILLVCRPCHTGFPARINQVRHPKSVLYYVGFEKNLEQDLGDALVSPVMDEPVGEAGEYVWAVKRESLAEAA